jgi:CRP/FNR family cyclic AMP-dependent transcriptional regulator
MAEVLSRVALFEDLSPEELEELARRFQVKRYRRHNLIIFEEDQEGSLFIIAKGRVKISRLSDCGAEVTLAILSEGGFFGDLSAIDGDTRSANATSLEDVDLLVMRRVDFMEVLQTMPQVSMAMIRELARRLRFSDWQIQNLCTRNAEARIAASLIYLAEETGTTHRGSVTIPYLPHQKDLANIAGTSRETVSRVLKSFKDRKECNREGRTMIIHDIDSFQRKYLG